MHRFYGPFAASLPSELTSVLDKYAQLFSYEMGGEAAYLFHPPQSGFDRPMESSAWTGWVKRLFKRHHGQEIAPKTLRSVFITWLRDNTAAPEILKSAAHAMKHSEERQASSDYDQESDDRNQHLELEPLVCACDMPCV
jgi:integrase